MKQALILALLGAAVGTGCYSPRLASQTCATRSDCGSGLVCLEGECSWCHTDSDCEVPERCGVPRAGFCGCYDADGDGSSCDDCDDNDATIFPAAAETCDGKDNNCNGLVDEGVIREFFADQDRDGFGDPALFLKGCVAPPGYVSNNGDCNDADPTAHPGALEVCDSRDNNCDGEIDEGVKRTYYRDADGDGFGDAANTLASCLVPASGYVERAGDCDDTRTDVNPDARESCNGRDDDCDGVIDNVTRSCDNACGTGVEVCDHGNWAGCTAPGIITVDTVTTLSGTSARYDCLTVTNKGRLIVAPDMALSTNNWLRVESGGVLELGPRASIESQGDLVFTSSAVLIGNEGTLRSHSSIQVTQDAKWFLRGPEATPYSGGGSRACASAEQKGVSGAGGGARGGNGGRGGTCGSINTQPPVGVGGLAASDGENGSACPATAPSEGGSPSGGGGGAPLSGGGGGANGGNGGAGASGTYLGFTYDGGSGGLAEPQQAVPMFGGGGGGSAGGAEVVYLGEVCAGGGGAGGGILRVFAPRFSNQGSLFADGAAGESPLGSYTNTGGGGGGGGGTWVFQVATFDNRGSISAMGGRGGDGHCHDVGSQCAGGGGGGGGQVTITGPDGGAPTILQLGNIYTGQGVAGRGMSGAEAGTDGSPGWVRLGP